jgi:PAS domain S-box-containing protein
VIDRRLPDRRLTDRRSETRISASERRFQALAAGAPIGIFASDADGAPVFFNERCGVLLGLPAGETGPVDWTRQLLADDVERAERAWTQAVREGGELSIRCARRAPGGELRHLDVSAGPVADADGALQGFVGTVVDATALVEATSALEQRNEELHELARSRDDLVAAVSHELRTPLTSIVMFLDLLADEPLSDGQRAALVVVARNTDRLERVIGDLLLMKDAGELELAREPVDLRAVAADALEALAPSAAEAGLTLTLAAPETEVIGRADRARVAQVLDVLLDNALKYTPRAGRVTVRVQDGDGEALLEVQDDGVGIAREDHERVFELFYRGQPSLHQGGGFGFGLAIVRQLAAAMDARVSLRSAPGDGSTFTLAMPAAER